MSSKKNVRQGTLKFLSQGYDFGLKAKNSDLAKTIIDTIFNGMLIQGTCAAVTRESVICPLSNF